MSLSPPPPLEREKERERDLVSFHRCTTDAQTSLLRNALGVRSILGLSLEHSPFGETQHHPPCRPQQCQSQAEAAAGGTDS